MASSVIDILHSLGLTEDSELLELLYKLEDYNLVTTEELRNIQNISVKPLPSIVRNQADALKQRMYGIATDEDYGLPVVINRRIVLIKYILSILKNRIDDLNTDLGDVQYSVEQLKIDLETELANEVARLDTNISTKAENSYVNQLKNNIESMLAQLNNTKVDKVNGKQLSTNDLTNELLSKLNSLYNYDDTNVRKQIDEIKVILTSNDVDFDTLQELVNALKNNTSSISDIFTALSKKANKTEIPTKTSQLENDANFATKEYVDNKVNDNQDKITYVDIEYEKIDISEIIIDNAFAEKILQLIREDKIANSCIRLKETYYNKIAYLSINMCSIGGSDTYITWENETLGLEFTVWYDENLTVVEDYEYDTFSNSRYSNVLIDSKLDAIKPIYIEIESKASSNTINEDFINKVLPFLKEETIERTHIKVKNLSSVSYLSVEKFYVSSINYRYALWEDNNNYLELTIWLKSDGTISSYTGILKAKTIKANQSDLEALEGRIETLESSSGGVLNQVFAVDEEGNQYEVYGLDKDGNKYLVLYEEV